MPLRLRNFRTMAEPNVYPAPLQRISTLQFCETTSRPRADSKVFLLRIRIRPDQVRHGALVWYLSEPVDDLDLIDVMYGRT